MMLAVDLMNLFPSIPRRIGRIQITAMKDLHAFAGIVPELWFWEKRLRKHLAQRAEIALGALFSTP